VDAAPHLVPGVARLGWTARPPVEGHPLLPMNALAPPTSPNVESSIGAHVIVMGGIITYGCCGCVNNNGKRGPPAKSTKQAQIQAQIGKKALVLVLGKQAMDQAGPIG